MEPFTAAEIEFQSEDELIEIVPRFTMPNLALITGDIGPFRAAIPIQVPIWLAFSLKKSQLCHIKPPFWLDAAHLKERLEHEKEHDSYFEPLPFHYMEIAAQLLDLAADDVPDHAKIKSVLLDIEEVRYAKMRKTLMGITGEDEAYKCNNISAMEINKVRPFMTKTVDRLHQVTVNGAELEE
eukprot:TRINITY_DN18909_c0_g1_i1.p1 TRINITY_DN18909_c0_g1~~TRINITY_DN18909_c0_g1_i1.p1  ORF type:complete len:182 (+),score=54.05 TRINITY_DN18909_c0_g1_i1:212-757(+)